MFDAFDTKDSFASLQLKTSKFIQKYKKNKLDAAFVANGRQPVQAAVTLGLRQAKISVITYEAGGGYVFPDILKKRIDYFFTSPANAIEFQGKTYNDLYITIQNWHKTEVATDFIESLRQSFARRSFAALFIYDRDAKVYILNILKYYYEKQRNFQVYPKLNFNIF